MSYTIDLEKISLKKYGEILQSQDLLPSRRILLDELEAKLCRIADAGVNNLLELKQNLSSPSKLSSFSVRTNIPEDYLVILKRELGSLEQKPVPIASFPGISELIVIKLKEQNIHTSRDLYHLIITKKDQEAVEIKGVHKNELDEIYCLCKLVRINGVGAVAARALYESGYRDIPDIAHTDTQLLLTKISEANSIGHYYNAKLGLKDMKFIIDYANLLLDAEKLTR